MSDRIRWIEHKGQKILIEEFTNLPEAEFVKAIQEAEKAMLESGDKNIFVLAKMEGVRMTDITKEAGQSLVDNTKAQGITVHSAMLGLSSLQRIIANAVKRDMYFGKTDDDAKDWLLKQAEKLNVKQPVG